MSLSAHSYKKSYHDIVSKILDLKRIGLSRFTLIAMGITQVLHILHVHLDHIIITKKPEIVVITFLSIKAV